MKRACLVWLVMSTLALLVACGGAKADKGPVLPVPPASPSGAEPATSASASPASSAAP